MPMQPRPMAETLRPLRPNWRVFMADPPYKLNERLEKPYNTAPEARCVLGSEPQAVWAHPDRCAGSTDDSQNMNWLAASTRTTGELSRLDGRADLRAKVVTKKSGTGKQNSAIRAQK